MTLTDNEILARRAVPEWIGATPNSKIPDRVKLRIWLREGGRCYLSGRQIRPGERFEYEHVIALCNGGENRETNLRLALAAPHKAKTAADVDERAKTDRMAKKHLGIKKPSSWGPLTRKMDGTVVRKDGR
jgi:5-methylcytosine-specific restriction protein A